MGKKNKDVDNTGVDDSELGFGGDVDESNAAAGLLDELKPAEGDEEKKPEGEPETPIPGAATASSSDEHGAPVVEPEAATAPAANINANLEGAQADQAPKVTDEKAQLAPSAHTAAENEPSQTETVNVEPAPEAKEDRANADAAKSDDKGEDKGDEPASFSALHDDVSELADRVGMEIMDELRKAGDALTPAVSKMHGIEKELHKLGDEAKARFVFAKAKAVEAMGALERLFKRG